MFPQNFMKEIKIKVFVLILLLYLSRVLIVENFKTKVVTIPNVEFNK